MAKLTKNKKLALSKIAPGKPFSLKEAATFLKEITANIKVSVCVRLSLNPKPKKQGPIMWDSMNTSKKLKTDG